MVLRRRMVRMERIEGTQPPTVEKHLHAPFPALPAGQEAVKHELEVRRRLVELPHQIPPIGTTIRTDETVELLPHNESAARH